MGKGTKALRDGEQAICTQNRALIVNLLNDKTLAGITKWKQYQQRYRNSNSGVRGNCCVYLIRVWYEHAVGDERALFYVGYSTNGKDGLDYHFKASEGLVWL